MTPSRRAFVLGGAGAGITLLAGCVQDDADDGTDDHEDTDDNDGDDTGGAAGSPDACEPLDLEPIDSPPHAPERPEPPDDIEDSDQWDAHYLGEGMDDDTEVAFDPLNLRYHEPLVGLPGEGETEHVAVAELIDSRESFEDRLEPVGEESTDRVADIDFDEKAVVVLTSGYGSSSVAHEWVRVDDNCEEVHVHGYYRQPYIQTDDITTRTSGVVVDRPAEYDLERAWVSLTVDESTRRNVSTEADDQLLLGTGTGGGDAIESVETIPVHRESAGDWHFDDTEETGVVVHLENAEEVTSLVPEEGDVSEFLGNTDFEEDTVFYVESVGPNACYNRIEFDEVLVEASTHGYSLFATAAVIDTSDEDESCAQVVTYPAVLLRVESDLDIPDGTVDLTDGWGESTRAHSQSLGEFAQE